MSIVENILSLRERFTAKLQKANIFDNFFILCMSMQKLKTAPNRIYQPLWSISRPATPERALKTLDIPEEEHDDYAELLRYFYPNVMQ